MILSVLNSADVTLLTSTFVLVKSLLFIIPQLVTQQYDTSSQLLFTSTQVPWIANYVLPRFLVWDTVFFIKIAQRGYIYEQEWAFNGWLWTGTIRVVGDIYIYAIAVIIIAHAFHYLAVVTLYIASTYVEKFIRPAKSNTVKKGRRSMFPLLSALLFIISPGGIFMSAGYSETLFAYFSFLGIVFREANFHVLAGVSFAITACIRGNGILWGIVFLNDLYESFIVRRKYGKSIGIIVGGSLVGAGFLSGQVFAYCRYCPGREWCEAMPPLIYKFVQSYYWDNGLFKYWRTWQIPNFFFAFPTWFLFYRSFQRYAGVSHLRPYVIIQALMGIMSLLLWHVQIITRVGTCMPLVYWYVAERRHEGLWEVRYMITWIGVQAVLFASFIPPA
ncbi:GPI mannosyltransferase 2 [Myxozyma melibiosi]|uniref:GPI mannosyltransferase 2 n=1 Tax=Myxozyma melibiosi TaxID=54550 RepID=A0ABR1FFK1_9ASCO